MRRAIYITLLCSILSLGSCSYIEEYIDHLEERTSNKPLARVGEVFLYPKDVAHLIPSGTTPQDSIAIIEKYIDGWATRQLVLMEAHKTISSEELEMEVNQFKELLLQGKYDQMVLSSQLDTVITREEMEEYYTAHKDLFLLEDDIVLFSSLPVTYCDDALVKRLKRAFARQTAPRLKTQRETDSLRAVWTWKGSIEEIMNEEAYNAPLVVDNWVAIDRISNTYITPEGFSYDIKHAFPYVFTLSRDGDKFLCRTTQIKRAGELAPLEYVETQVRAILLNRRKVETIRSSQERLKNEALNNKKFEIFTSNEDN